MGFFDRFYYGKAGKRDYTELDMPKTRTSLFFLVLKDHFFDLIKVNLMQLVFWIPFIFWTYMNIAAIQNLDMETILAGENGAQVLMDHLITFLVTWLLGLIPCLAITGPSTAGASYIMRNWARDDHAFIFSDFKDAFKSNWKQALLVSILTGVAPVVFYSAVTYYYQLTAGNMFMIVPMVLVLTMCLLWAMMLSVLYPLMVGYELKTKNLFKNAFLIAAARAPQLFLARIITFVPFALFFLGIYVGNAIMVMVATVYYLLFGFAFSRLVYASFANSAFDKFINPYIEGAKVNQGLRPRTEDDDILEGLADDDDDDDDDEDEE